MTDINEAIDITTNVDIKWSELGRVFAEQSSPDQADFLIGFYESVADMQLAYIGLEPAFDVTDRDDVAQVLVDLADHIRRSRGESS